MGRGGPGRPGRNPGQRHRLEDRAGTALWAERGVLILLLIAAVTSAALLVRKYRPRRAEIGGMRWTEILRCDFSDDWCPAGWGWGNWTLTDGSLTGRTPVDQLAVYFFGEPAASRYGAWDVRQRVVPGARTLGRSDEPCGQFLHAGDFVLEARVRLMQPAEGEDAEAQLLIRDSNRVVDVTGVTLRAERTTARVRYRVGGNEHIYHDVQLDQRTRYGRWYLVQFVAREGHIQAIVDGAVVFDSRFDVGASRSSFAPDYRTRYRASDSGAGARSQSLPVGTFVEPHIAVKNGVAQFERVSLYVLDD